MLLFLWFTRHLALALIFLVLSTSCHRISLAPLFKRQRPQAALIVVAAFDPQQYVPIANRIQQELSAVDLWVSVVNTTEELRLVRDGLPRSTPAFLLGIFEQTSFFQRVFLIKRLQGTRQKERLSLKIMRLNPGTHLQGSLRWARLSFPSTVITSSRAQLHL